MPAIDSAAFERQAAASIDALHRVLQAWFNAEGSDDPAVVLAHFDPAFIMMTPAGGQSTYAQFSAALPTMRGSRSGLVMEISDVVVRYVDDHAALVTYHERQTLADVTTNRVSTALLLNGHDSGIPQWRHLQETWKP